MNWMNKHLNWSYVLAHVIYFFACFIIGFVYAVINPYYQESSIDVLCIVIWFIFLLPVSGVIIKKKGRSLWWLLLSGYFSPLWLGNKTTYDKAEGKE